MSVAAFGRKPHSSIFKGLRRSAETPLRGWLVLQRSHYVGSRIFAAAPMICHSISGVWFLKFLFLKS
jgi:hypothetical protein